MKCDGCQKPVAKTDHYCRHCGRLLDTRLERAIESAVARRVGDAERRYRNWTAVAAAALFAVMGFLGYEKFSNIEQSANAATAKLVDGWEKRIEARLLRLEEGVQTQIETRLTRIAEESDQQISGSERSIRTARAELRRVAAETAELSELVNKNAARLSAQGRSQTTLVERLTTASGYSSILSTSVLQYGADPDRTGLYRQAGLDTPGYPGPLTLEGLQAGPKTDDILRWSASLGSPALGASTTAGDPLGLPLGIASSPDVLKIVLPTLPSARMPAPGVQPLTPR